MKKIKFLFCLAAAVLLTGCKDEPKENPEAPVIEPSVGFYLLNQGNMGTNNASIDYYDFATQTLTTDYFVAQNPTVTMGLGDVGNDLAIHGGKLWAVMNASNKVEVMDATTCKRIGQVDIPNCRYITFDGEYAYVTSYAGAVWGDGNQKGYVAKIDTGTLQVVGKVQVGYQPDGLCVYNRKLYVANSNGYVDYNMPGTVSVINLEFFKVEKELTIGMNLNKILVDSYGYLWITSRGNYADVPSSIYWVNTETGTVQKHLEIPNSNVCLAGENLYVLGVNYNYATNSNTISYHEISTYFAQVKETSWTGSAEFSQLVYPYGIAVDEESGDIYITDAGDFITPGWIYCFSADKEFKWKKRAGEAPCCIAFLR